MPRIILLAVLFLILYWLLKRVQASLRHGSQSGDARHHQKLIQCHQCGLRVPESESLLIHGKSYCNNPTCNPDPTKN